MNGTREILIGVLVGAIGAVSLAVPGGWDWLSAVNLFMGGVLIGIGYATRTLLR